VKKHERQKRYGVKFLKNFQCQYMFWSPVVPVGFITESLSQLPDLELVVNGDYKRRIDELKVLARETTHDARNPVFRVLQILEHMRG
jgi:hypothetical protein